MFPGMLSRNMSATTLPHVPTPMPSHSPFGTTVNFSTTTTLVLISTPSRFNQRRSIIHNNDGRRFPRPWTSSSFSSTSSSPNYLEHVTRVSSTLARRLQKLVSELSPAPPNSLSRRSSALPPTLTQPLHPLLTSSLQHSTAIYGALCRPTIDLTELLDHADTALQSLRTVEHLVQTAAAAAAQGPFFLDSLLSLLAGNTHARLRKMLKRRVASLLGAALAVRNELAGLRLEVKRARVLAVHQQQGQQEQEQEQEEDEEEEEEEEEKGEREEERDGPEHLGFNDAGYEAENEEEEEDVDEVDNNDDDGNGDDDDAVTERSFDAEQEGRRAPIIDTEMNDLTRRLRALQGGGGGVRWRESIMARLSAWTLR